MTYTCNVGFIHRFIAISRQMYVVLSLKNVHAEGCTGTGEQSEPKKLYLITYCLNEVLNYRPPPPSRY